MRFRIVRTTDCWRKQPEKPCEKAILVEDEPLKSPFPQQEWSIKVHHWEIEISSLEELMDLVKEVGEPIIVTEAELEIYDGYRE